MRTKVAGGGGEMSGLLIRQMQGGDVPRDRRIESEQKDGLVAGPMMGSVGTRCVNNGGIMDDKVA
jgi:hypothetical protein